jgi:hypothetical protein
VVKVEGERVKYILLDKAKKRAYLLFAPLANMLKYVISASEFTIKESNAAAHTSLVS